MPVNAAEARASAEPLAISARWGNTSDEITYSYYESFAPQKWRQPEQALQKAVLQDAIDILKTRFGEVKGRGKRQAINDALVWLADDTSDEPFSFCGIVSSLLPNYHPSAVRKAILSIRPEQPDSTEA